MEQPVHETGSSTEKERLGVRVRPAGRPAVTLVVDASVVVKWLLTYPFREAATAQAEQLMAAVLEGREA